MRCSSLCWFHGVIELSPDGHSASGVRVYSLCSSLSCCIDSTLHDTVRMHP